MVDLTGVQAQIFDALRPLRWGANASLKLLRHNPDGGFLLIAQITRGWNVTGGTGVDDPLVLKVAESAEASPSDLLKAGAIAINNVVYNFSADDRAAPSAPNKLVWSFQINPTSDVYAD